MKNLRKKSNLGEINDFSMFANSLKTKNLIGDLWEDEDDELPSEILPELPSLEAWIKIIENQSKN